MAGRPNKAGLDYFELDCHMEEKVRLIQAEFGLKGFAIVVKLYQKIYGEFGYYCEWNEDSLLLFMSENGVSSRDEKNLIDEIVAACIRRDIFSKRLFDEFGILTSSGVQERYLNATSKREKVELKKEYLLINEPINTKNVVVNSISDVRNSVSDIGNEQSKVEKSKEEKRKVKESRGKSAAKAAQPTAGQIIDERAFPAELDAAVREWVKYKIEKRQAYKETGLRNFLTQIENNAKTYGAAPVIDLIRYCMSQNWQGVIWDRLAEGKHGARHETNGRSGSGISVSTDENGTVWPVVGGVDWSKV